MNVQLLASTGPVRPNPTVAPAPQPEPPATRVRSGEFADRAVALHRADDMLAAPRARFQDGEDLLARLLLDGRDLSRLPNLTHALRELEGAGTLNPAMLDNLYQLISSLPPEKANKLLGKLAANARLDALLRSILDRPRTPLDGKPGFDYREMLKRKEEAGKRWRENPGLLQSGRGL